MSVKAEIQESGFATVIEKQSRLEEYNTLLVRFASREEVLIERMMRLLANRPGNRDVCELIADHLALLGSFANQMMSFDADIVAACLSKEGAQAVLRIAYAYEVLGKHVAGQDSGRRH